MRPGDLCFVSGVNGFLGSWIARELLQAGLRVRGSVRSFSDENKVSALQSLLPGICLLSADLLSEPCCRQALKGRKWIFHVANPQAVKPESGCTANAISSTQFLLMAAAAVHSVQKVVLTSSEAASSYGHQHSKWHFDESDWTDLRGLDKRADYHRNKTLAERWAWYWADDIKLNPGRIPLPTINPSLILGPSLVPWRMFGLGMLGDIPQDKMPVILDMTACIVDVKDCARIHLAVLRNPSCDCQRHLCMSRPTILAELAQSISCNYASQGFSPRVRLMPSWIAQLMAPFSPDISRVRNHIGNRTRYTTLHRKVYCYRYRDTETIVRRSIGSMLAHGWLRPRAV